MAAAKPASVSLEQLQTAGVHIRYQAITSKAPVGLHQCYFDFLNIWRQLAEKGS